MLQFYCLSFYFFFVNCQEKRESEEREDIEAVLLPIEVVYVKLFIIFCLSRKILLSLLSIKLVLRKKNQKRDWQEWDKGRTAWKTECQIRIKEKKCWEVQSNVSSMNKECLETWQVSRPLVQFFLRSWDGLDVLKNVNISLWVNGSIFESFFNFFIR